MARIPYVEKDQAPPEVAETFAKMEVREAAVLNLWKMAAHSPSTLLHLIRLGNSLLSKTRLDPKLREIAILRTAAITDCDYERSQHIIFGKEMGVTDEQLGAIKDWENSSVFTGTEQAVLRFTDEVSKNLRVKDETFSNLAQHLDQGMIMELAQTVGFYGLIARILIPFEVDLEAPMSPSQLLGHPEVKKT
jgi:4-carboxymuconolactone decarboxylase